MVEGNYLRNQESLCKLFYHEAMRLFADKILLKHDYDWFIKELKVVCEKNFDVVEKLPPMMTLEERILK